MEPLRVLIENLQDKPWTETWIPIIIATIALGTSIVSLLMTRIQYRRSSRPYICAMSYANLQNNLIIPIPSLVGYRVTNSPAKIHESIVSIFLPTEVLMNHCQENFVRYNSSDSEWTFGVGQNEFNQIIQDHGNNPELRRKIQITYSSLDGGKKYSFSLVQNFVAQDNQWKDITVHGN